MYISISVLLSMDIICESHPFYVRGSEVITVSQIFHCLDMSVNNGCSKKIFKKRKIFKSSISKTKEKKIKNWYIIAIFCFGEDTSMKF